MALGMSDLDAFAELLRSLAGDRARAIGIRLRAGNSDGDLATARRLPAARTFSSARFLPEMGQERLPKARPSLCAL